MSHDLEDRLRKDYAVHSEILASLPGSASLLAQYEHLPDFHDAVAKDVSLSTSGKSLIRLANPYPTIFDAGYLLVTFEIDKVIDANLDFFGGNILFGLMLRRPAARPDRQPYLTRPIEAGDIEFEFEPTCGLSGFVVGRGVRVSWTKDRRARTDG